jgi:O-antigen ligase
MYASANRSMSDKYLVLLSCILLGYAVGGKGFAYLGFPPLYIGELALLIGSVVFLRTSCAVAVLTTLPSLLLVAAMLLVLSRTLPLISVYGMDSLRDSTVVMYGAFAFIVIALVLEDSRRINTIIQYYNRFLSIFIPAAPFIVIISRYLSDYTPKLPFYNVPIVLVKAGEVASHVTAAAVFMLVGFRVATFREILCLLITAVIISSSRGAMLAMAIPIVLAMFMLGRVRQLIAPILIALAIFSAALAVEIAFSEQEAAVTDSDERPVTPRQLAINAMGIVGYGNEQTEGTKTWRIEWWKKIIADTVYGPNFWTGRGFGLNLADADGYQDGDHPDLPPLRSPHNVNMTILARAGVPGAALWAGLLASWFFLMLQSMRLAQRRGQRDWAGLFLFVCCYDLSILIDASFDVALEGPMLSVWFWCVFGFGIGSTMVYQHQTRERA